MTVSSVGNKVSYVGDGSTVTFSYSYRMDNDADMRTFLDGDWIQSGYSVSRDSDNVGGSVTFSVAPAAGVKVTLYRFVQYTQLTNYTEYDPFPAETHERALDKLTMEVQQLDEITTRTIVTPVGSTPDGGYYLLPEYAPLKVLGWHATLNKLVNIDNLTGDGGGGSDFVPLGGGTMTGDLRLNNDVRLHFVTDGNANDWSAVYSSVDGSFYIGDATVNMQFSDAGAVHWIAFSHIPHVAQAEVDAQNGTVLNELASVQYVNNLVAGGSGGSYVLKAGDSMAGALLFQQSATVTTRSEILQFQYATNEVWTIGSNAEGLHFLHGTDITANPGMRLKPNAINPLVSDMFLEPDARLHFGGTAKDWNIIYDSASQNFIFGDAVTSIQLSETANGEIQTSHLPISTASQNMNLTNQFVKVGTLGSYSLTNHTHSGYMNTTSNYSISGLHTYTNTGGGTRHNANVEAFFGSGAANISHDGTYLTIEGVAGGNNIQVGNASTLLNKDMQTTVTGAADASLMRKDYIDLGDAVLLANLNTAKADLVNALAAIAILSGRIDALENP